MKRCKKSIVAILCVVMMMAGSVLPNCGSIVRAAEHEWSIFSGSQELVSSGAIYYANGNLSCEVPTTVDFEDLALRIKVTIEDESTIYALQKSYVELTQAGVCDQKELTWSLIYSDMTVGENEIYLDFSDATNRNGSNNEPFEVGQAINYFRVFSSGTVSATSAILTELTLVDVTEAGLDFGETDTYLQLENQLTETPQTIEASVKMAEPQREWTVVSTSQIVNGTPVAGVTTEGEAPGANVGYVDVTIDAGTTIVTGTGNGITFEALDFGKYDKSDLTLAFWYYSNEAGTLPSGEIELASYQNRTDTQEIYWNTSKISVAKGWNYIELPLSSPTGNSYGNATYVGEENVKAFDFTNLVRVRWFTTYSDTSTAWNFRMTDMKIVAPALETEAEPETEWTLLETKQFASTTTGVTTADDTPGAGVTYATYAITSGLSYVVSNTTFAALDFGSYAKEHLALAFWMKADSAGYLPLGEIELGNDADTEGVQIFWRTDNIYLEEGWNYIELPFSTSYYSSVSDSFDVSNLMRVRWFFNDNTADISCNFSVTELHVVATEGAEWRIANATICSGGSEIKGADRGEDGPDASWNVVEVDTTGTQQHFKKTDVATPDFGEYTQDDLVLAFWYYSYETEDATLPAGQLELSSDSSSNDSHEIRWSPQELVVEPGWNYLELPLSGVDGLVAGGFDLSNLTFVRWYRNAVDGSFPQWQFKLSDMKIIAKNAPTERWTLYEKSTINTTYTYAATHEDSAAQVLLSNSSISGLDFTGYSKEDLSLAFWYYSYVEGTLPSGCLEITSSGQYDNQELNWKTGEISVDKGWNHITLPLSEASAQGADAFVLEDLNYVRWYINKGSLTDEWKFRMSPKIELVATAKDTTSELTLQEVSDVSNLNEYMIFSNLNAGDSNDYALFITQEGYPSLLWGSHQFVLKHNVFTEEWVDIAVVHNEDKTISFYIDGLLSATSSETVDDLGTFTTAHCIGADGKGAQLMKGKIADVRLWSDVRTAEEIKNNLEEKQYMIANGKLSAGAEGLIENWFLYGDIQYILESMNGLNGNTAVYRGSRVDDWYDYDMSEHEFLWTDTNENGTMDSGEENYWSLVFIPDIQNLTVGSPKYQEIWMNMAQWIADNVDEENIKHVIGAGDTTWDDAVYQYENAMEGIELFDSKVPFSNLIGNHDYVWKATYRDSTNYQTYFGLEEYVQQEGKAIQNVEFGYFADERAEDSTSNNTKTETENSYYRFTVNDTSWMILQLEYHPRMCAINWADEILKQYPNDNVILATHGYIDGSGNYCGEGMTYLDKAETADGSDYIDNTGVIWEELQDNTNIKLILCGHSVNDTGAITVREETNAEGRTVKALMINAQDEDANETPSRNTRYYSNRPLGMLGILRFSEDGERVAVQYYSPTDEKSFNPADSAVSTERTTKDLTLEYGVEPQIVAYTNGATAGVLPVDEDTYKADGYVFAGWFADENCTTPLEGSVSGKIVYAKYVHKDVLSVKAQVSLEENGTLVADKASIRFVTTVDSLEYQKVGFEIQIGDTEARTVGTNTVYSSLCVLKADADNGELVVADYKPYEKFDLQSLYFKAFTIKNVPAEAYDTKICVRAYWITLDGTMVYSDQVSKTVNDVFTSQ